MYISDGLIYDALSITNDRRLCLKRFYTFHAALGEFELAAVLHVLHTEDYFECGQLPIGQVLLQNSCRILRGQVCRPRWPGWIHSITFRLLLVADKSPTEHLVFRQGNSSTVDPYMPCRFARQFGYDQLYVGR